MYAQAPYIKQPATNCVISVNLDRYKLSLNSLFCYRGKNTATEEAFTRDYGRLAELRSFLHRDVPFVALTATATKETKKTIIKDLCIQHCVQIIGDPNKRNIRYAVVAFSHSDP